MAKPPMAFVESEVRHRLSKIASMFDSSIKLTLIARLPSDDEADFVVTSDEIPAAIAALERSQARGFK